MSPQFLLILLLVLLLHMMLLFLCLLLLKTWLSPSLLLLPSLSYPLTLPLPPSLPPSPLHHLPLLLLYLKEYPFRICLLLLLLRPLEETNSALNRLMKGDTLSLLHPFLLLLPVKELKRFLYLIIADTHFLLLLLSLSLRKYLFLSLLLHHS